MDTPSGSPITMHQEGRVAPSSPLNERAVYLRNALSLAAQTLSRVPSLVQDFSEAPNSLDEEELDVADSERERSETYGIIEHAQLPDANNSRVPRMPPAPWRDQIPRRPALPAVSRVWLPTEFFVKDAKGTVASARLGYNYFHGNLVYHDMFIATQAPLVKYRKINDIEVVYDTRADFWLAMRHKNVRCIVMLASWQERPHVTRYLPLTSGSTEVYYAFPGGVPPAEIEMDKPGGPPGWIIRVAVTTVEVETIPLRSIAVRHLEVRFSVRNVTDGSVVEDNYVHRVRHDHYYGWPDGGIPATVEEMLGIISVAHDALLNNTPNEPTAIHCLAGHGRTGTLIVTVAAFRGMTKEDKTLSHHLLDTFYKIRTERYFLVQNSLQLLYSFSCFVSLLSAAQKRANVPLIASVSNISARLSEMPRKAMSLVCVRCLKEVSSFDQLTRLDHMAEGTSINFCSRPCAIQFVKDQWPESIGNLTEASSFAP